MAKVRVPSYARISAKGKRHKVKAFYRDKRPLGKRNIIGKTPVKLYPVTDQFGQFKGWSTKRGKQK